MAFPFTLPNSFLEAFSQTPVLVSDGLADRDVKGLLKFETKLLNILAATRTLPDSASIQLFGVAVSQLLNLHALQAYD